MDIKENYRKKASRSLCPSDGISVVVSRNAGAITIWQAASRARLFFYDNISFLLGREHVL